MVMGGMTSAICRSPQVHKRYQSGSKISPCEAKGSAGFPSSGTAKAVRRKMIAVRRKMMTTSLQTSWGIRAWPGFLSDLMGPYWVGKPISRSLARWSNFVACTSTPQ